jgi:hypothetical protein
MVQRHKICMAISMDHMRVVSVPPITWHSGVKNSVGHMGTDVVMQQDDAITEFTIIVFFFFKSWCVALKVFHSNSLH